MFLALEGRSYARYGAGVSATSANGFVSRLGTGTPDSHSQPHFAAPGNYAPPWILLNLTSSEVREAADPHDNRPNSTCFTREGRDPAGRANRITLATLQLGVRFLRLRSGVEPRLESG